MLDQNTRSFAGESLAQASSRSAPPSPSTASSMIALAAEVVRLRLPLGRPLPALPPFRA